MWLARKWFSKKRRKPNTRLTAFEMWWCAREGARIYEKMREQLEREHYGQFICINVRTGDYVVRDRLADASAAADKQFEGDMSYLTRIGEPLRVYYAVAA